MGTKSIFCVAGKRSSAHQHPTGEQWCVCEELRHDECDREEHLRPAGNCAIESGRNCVKKGCQGDLLPSSLHTTPYAPYIVIKIVPKLKRVLIAVVTFSTYQKKEV